MPVRAREPGSAGADRERGALRDQDWARVRGARQHALPVGGHLLELVLGEVAQEALAHAGEVGRPRALEQLLPLPREHRVEAAPVVVAGVADEQALALEPVDEAGHAGAGEQHAVGELRHPQPLLRGVLEVDQDVVRGQGEAMGGIELGVERAQQRRVDAQHPAPGAELGRRELCVGRGERGHARQDIPSIVAHATRRLAVYPLCPSSRCGLLLLEDPPRRRGGRRARDEAPPFLFSRAERGDHRHGRHDAGRARVRRRPGADRVRRAPRRRGRCRARPGDAAAQARARATRGS